MKAELSENQGHNWLYSEPEANLKTRDLVSKKEKSMWFVFLQSLIVFFFTHNILFKKLLMPV